MIKYSYAYDDKGNIVKINDAIKGHHYFCLGCRKEIIAKIGLIRSPHFAHKKDEVCDPEGYLHKLAKSRIKQIFLQNKDFTINYNREHQCHQYGNCAFHTNYCSINRLEKTPINLKTYYDTITEESEFKGFRADLLLSNSKKKDRPPVFIEIKVTHACEEKKISSDIKIIEIEIETEDDINQLDNHIVESDKIHFNNHFLRTSKETSEPLGIPVVRFFLYRSGKARVVPTLTFEMVAEYEYTCCDKRAKVDRHSIYEAEWPIPYNTDIWPLLIGLVKANESGMNIRNCWLCKYHDYHCAGGIGDALFCKAYKSKGTPSHPEQNQAVNCPYYEIEMDQYSLVKRIMEEMLIQEYK